MQSPAALLAGLCALGLGAAAASLAQAQVQSPADNSAPLAVETTTAAPAEAEAKATDAPPPVLQRLPQSDVDADSTPGLPRELMLAPAQLNSDDDGVVITQA